MEARVRGVFLQFTRRLSVALTLPGHRYEAKRNGKSALKLARFLWRHVLSVKHPVLKAIWVRNSCCGKEIRGHMRYRFVCLLQDVGIVGLEPEKYVNELRTQRGLPQGVEDRQEYGFSFLDTHGAIVVRTVTCDFACLVVPVFKPLDNFGRQGQGR